MKKILNILIFFVLLLMIPVSRVRAACDPPECGVPGLDCTQWGPSFQCIAKCCVDPNGGSGGGSNCPAECRGGSSCGAGYSPASGCPGTGPNFGCASNKVCCKANSCPNNTPPGGGSCNVTAPVINSITRDSVNSATVNWTPGGGGNGLNTQQLYVDADQADVENGCPGSSCLVKLTGLSNSLSSRQVSGLSAGTIYYVRVVNYVINACQAASDTYKYLSSCVLSPATLYLTTQSPDYTATLIIEQNDLEIQRVDFLAPPGNVAINPGSDSSYPYQVVIKPVSPTDPTVDLTANVYFTGGGGLACTSNLVITVTAPGAWWQVIDSDIQSMGDIASFVVNVGEYFNLPGPGGYPGVVAYTGTASFNNGTVSPEGWLANSSALNSRIFDYAFFNNQIPESVIPTDAASGLGSPGSVFYGYEWFKHTGPTDFNIDSSLDFGSRKVILLVENANLNINANTALTDGQGFFMAIVQGDININPSVTSLEGLYVSDGSTSTGTLGEGLDSQLYVRGSLAAYGGLNLQRNLADNAPPAEIFEFAPDQILLFPGKLAFRRINWKEVAP